jgi:hypothetical protein|tara:strand:- start:719 stop:874 length:156 start_codon:yes stop_codon:yes gene_type:complete
MIHFQIIWEHIQAHAVAIGVALLAFLATLSIFLPRNSKLFKIITFLTKKKK